MKKITMSQASSIEYCKGYNDAIDEINQHMMHPIICKYARRNFAIPVIGEMYYLDKDSIAIMDGETYGNIYRKEENGDFTFLAFLSMNHFTSHVEKSE